MLASDCELRVAELQLRAEDFSIGRFIETRMKLPDPLGCPGIARGVRLQQVLGLIAEMIETRIPSEGFYRHDELPRTGCALLRKSNITPPIPLLDSNRPLLNSNQMLRALLLAALLTALAAGQVPVANFTGTVHDISKKQVTIDTGDGNLLDFEINRKTKVMRAKKEIKAEEIMTGDQVIIEGRQEMLRFFVAVVITVQPPAPKDNP